MDPRTAKRILDALREEFREAGFPQPEEAVEIARSALTKKEEGVNLLASSIVLGFWEEFIQGLKEAPEPTSEALNEQLMKLKDLRYQFRDRLLDAGKKTPHRPGGAPPKLTSKQRKQATELVGILMGQGDTYSEAVEKIARRFDVSPKTIQREWQKAHHRKRTAQDGDKA
jgi:hypothetical protein